MCLVEQLVLTAVMSSWAVAVNGSRALPAPWASVVVSLVVVKRPSCGVVADEDASVGSVVVAAVEDPASCVLGALELAVVAVGVCLPSDLDILIPALWAIWQVVPTPKCHALDEGLSRARASFQILNPEARQASSIDYYTAVRGSSGCLAVVPRSRLVLELKLEPELELSVLGLGSLDCLAGALKLGLEPEQVR